MADLLDLFPGREKIEINGVPIGRPQGTLNVIPEPGVTITGNQDAALRRIDLHISGTQGAFGAQGNQGWQGFQGIQGIQGPQGYQGTESSFTNASLTPLTVGGIPAGSSFSNASMTEMWDDLLYPELFPTLVNPDNAFALTQSGLHEIGEVVTLNFNATFSRGTITPAYGTSGYRSGLPNAYNYTGTGLPAAVGSTSLSNAQTVSGYTVLTGSQAWGSTTSYDGGEQPKSSKGNDYSTPLAAGTTGSKATTITGVYPYYATTVAITTLTKQALAVMNSAYVQTNEVAEDDLGNKQAADFPAGWSAITGVQFFNTVSNTWEYINGSKANSLLTFTTSSVTHSIQGSTINYTRYTNNSSKTGARQLRWYTT